MADEEVSGATSLTFTVLFMLFWLLCAFQAFNILKK